MSFVDKVVIVTGGASGIGKKIALDFAEKGAIVVVGDINVREENSKIALSIKTDVSIEKDIVHLIKVSYEKFGRIDILINNAGISKWISPYDLNVEEWDHIMNTNLRSVFIASREAGKIMRNHGGGSIVNISSTRGIMSEPNSEAYAASKGGIIAITHALASSMAKDKIQVNCISPGWIETKDNPELRDKDHLQHFSGRVGITKDISNACLFLTNPENNFISGTNLVIDGGMTKKMIYE